MMKQVCFDVFLNFIQTVSLLDLPQQHLHLEQEELPAKTLFCHHLQMDQLEPDEESKTFLVALLYGEGEPRVAEETFDGLQTLHQEGGEDSFSQAGRDALKCDFCGKIFRKKYHLKMHHMNHTGEKPYVCNECGKSFKAASTLRYHARLHTGEKPYSCETCGKSFRCSYSMLVHMRTHTGEKPYLCNTCGKRFTNSSAFKWHTAIHMGDRRYSCQICGKSFTQILLNCPCLTLSCFS
uniref:C2H2-type domain-containing protein n=1 Tax=Xiphophorus maculatus TaxID=8083 RepID=A0A3B5QUS2_XIPMA